MPETTSEVKGDENAAEVDIEAAIVHATNERYEEQVLSTPQANAILLLTNKNTVDYLLYTNVIIYCFSFVCYMIFSLVLGVHV